MEICTFLPRRNVRKRLWLKTYLHKNFKITNSSREMKARAAKSSVSRRANYFARAVHLPGKFSLLEITAATRITASVNSKIPILRYATPRAIPAVQAIVIAPIRNVIAHESWRARRGIHKSRESATFRERIPDKVKTQRKMY